MDESCDWRFTIVHVIKIPQAEAETMQRSLVPIGKRKPGGISCLFCSMATVKAHSVGERFTKQAQNSPETCRHAGAEVEYLRGRSF